MTWNEPRYVLSQEEIGILLSFAKRPEAITREWARRLRSGVDRDELYDLFALAGLSRSTARGFIDRSQQESSEGKSDPAQLGFRRAMIGSIVVYTLAAVAFLIAAQGITLGVVTMVGVFILCAGMLYRVIPRLAAARR